MWGFGEFPLLHLLLCFDPVATKPKYGFLTGEKKDNLKTGTGGGLMISTMDWLHSRHSRKI